MSLRQRIPFRADEDTEDRVVLDEVEQDEVIDTLHKENTRSTANALLIVDTVLSLASILQLSFLFNGNPLLALFPPSTMSNLGRYTIPYPAVFVLFALVLHANLALHLHPALIRVLLPSYSNSTPLPVAIPLSYPLTFSLAAVPPTFCLFLHHAWQANAWAASPFIVVTLIHSVHETLSEGSEALAELESLRYRAPGP
ncbi:unnamed protein product [Mycena citricolor]|uniref:Uncharacterized protein n=1 Tax=Mycena citricolor TaxID=2018698 RepID=A0AAD2HZJ9_9AGAR|nr:unnamed protein product [Mycena citricolor]